MTLWSWQEPSMRLHFTLNTLLLTCAFFCRRFPKPFMLNMLLVLVILIVMLDFVGLVAPAWIWPKLAGRVGVILITDLACMAETAAVLYSMQYTKEMQGELDRLRSMKYKITTA